MFVERKYHDSRRFLLTRHPAFFLGLHRYEGGPRAEAVGKLIALYGSIAVGIFLGYLLQLHEPTLPNLEKVKSLLVIVPLCSSTLGIWLGWFLSPRKRT